MSYSKEQREAARQKARREAAREFACPSNFDPEASYTYEHPELGAVAFIAHGERWLKRDLIQMYPESGCPAVRYEREDLIGDHSGITIQRMLELMNVYFSTFAPIFLYCPETCGETLDVITLFAHASKDFRIGERELNQLSTDNFKTLVDLWNRRERDEARAEALNLRNRLLADPDQPGSAIMTRALAVFERASDAPVDDTPDLVTLAQAAAMAHRTKRALEYYKTKGTLPTPSVEGGGGQADLYDWKTIGPWLESTFGVKQPGRFPASRRS